MKILQSISSMGVNAGGPTTCTFNLLKGLRGLGVETHLLTFDVSSSDDKLIANSPEFMRIIEPPKYPRFGYKKEWKEWLKQHTDYDLYHANALWQYPAHATIKAAILNNKPSIISTHGMLYPEGLKKSKWVKKVSLFLYQNKDLKNATAFHATSEKEKEYIREFGLVQPIAVIPNAIDTSNFGLPNFEPKTGKRKVGFMGRLCPIKNIESLIEAWAIAAPITNHHELVIMGDGDSGYKEQLVKLAQDLGVTNVKYTGFVTGKVQDKLLSELSYLVLPSLSENFGMVVPEALWKGIPVIASKGTPWEELETQRCGWWTNNDSSSLAQALQIALQIEETERIAMGKRGNELIAEKYTLNAVGQMMKAFYEWVIVGGVKPEYINVIE